MDYTLKTVLVFVVLVDLWSSLIRPRDIRGIYAAGKTPCELHVPFFALSWLIVHDKEYWGRGLPECSLFWNFGEETNGDQRHLSKARACLRMPQLLKRVHRTGASRSCLVNLRKSDDPNHRLVVMTTCPCGVARSLRTRPKPGVGNGWYRGWFSAQAQQFAISSKKDIFTSLRSDQQISNEAESAQSQFLGRRWLKNNDSTSITSRYLLVLIELKKLGDAEAAFEEQSLRPSIDRYLSVSLEKIYLSPSFQVGFDERSWWYHLLLSLIVGNWSWGSRLVEIFFACICAIVVVGRSWYPTTRSCCKKVVVLDRAT